MISADKSERGPAKKVAGKLLLTSAKIINLEISSGLGKGEQSGISLGIFCLSNRSLFTDERILSG
jgi:hypothetical protein